MEFVSILQEQRHGSQYDLRCLIPVTALHIFMSRLPIAESALLIIRAISRGARQLESSPPNLINSNYARTPSSCTKVQRYGVDETELGRSDPKLHIGGEVVFFLQLAEDRNIFVPQLKIVSSDTVPIRCRATE
jgi:hypothetical protein